MQLRLDQQVKIIQSQLVILHATPNALISCSLNMNLFLVLEYANIHFKLRLFNSVEIDSRAALIESCLLFAFLFSISALCAQQCSSLVR